MKLIDIKCIKCTRIATDRLVQNSVAEGLMTAEEANAEHLPSKCDGACSEGERCYTAVLSVSSTKGHSSWSVK